MRRFLDDLATGILAFLWVSIAFLVSIGVFVWSIKWLINGLTALGVL